MVENRDGSKQHVVLNDDKLGTRPSRHSLRLAAIIQWEMNMKARRQKWKPLQNVPRPIQWIWETPSSSFPFTFFLPSHVFAFSVSSAFCLFQNLLPKRLRSKREVAVCRRYWKPHGVYSGLLYCQTTLKPMFFFFLLLRKVMDISSFTWTQSLPQSMAMAHVIRI